MKKAALLYDYSKPSHHKKEKRHETLNRDRHSRSGRSHEREEDFTQHIVDELRDALEEVEEESDNYVSSESSDDSEDETVGDQSPQKAEYQITNEDMVGKSRIGIENFKICKVIGQGAYGKVYLVRKSGGVDNNSLYAMKVLKKASLVYTKKKTRAASDRALMEKNVLLEIGSNSDFIVKLFYSFQVEDKVCLILDYIAGGELFTYLASEKMISESDAAFYLGEIVLALDHLHKCGIIYRDLKPENILLDHVGHVKLTDFGLSKVSLNGKTSTFCGTTEFMAPEIIKNQVYTFCVDWWSLGALAFDMLTGSPPFFSNNQKTLMDKICKEKVKFPKYLTKEAVAMLRKLLNKDPEKRLGCKGAVEIKRDIFFRKIDWKKLENKLIDPPIVPKIEHLAEAENFVPQFTRMDAVLSPVGDTTLSTSMEDIFKGFSYVDSDLINQLNKG